MTSTRLAGLVILFLVCSPAHGQNSDQRVFAGDLAEAGDARATTVGARVQDGGAVSTSQASQTPVKPAAAAGQGAPSSATPQQSDDSSPQQSKRILWIIPNYRAVSAGTYLPPQTAKEKFKLATDDSFDYSSFVLAGLLAGYSQATNATPEFQQELSGYGRYYWHSFVDEAVGNYFTEAIIPLATHEDPRYYTLGNDHGALHRTAYAISRLVVTRTDAGGRSFNFSEIVGNALGAGVSNAYYPAQERTLGNNADKWATQIGIDGIANLLKEFWPDIRHSVLREKQ